MFLSWVFCLHCVFVSIASAWADHPATSPRSHPSLSKPSGLSGPEPIRVRPFKVRSIQSPTYQGPTYRGRIYQGPGYYPDLGRIIQQPPVATGPVYQSPTGATQVVPPVAQRVQQPSRPTPQQALDAEQAAYNAEKLALVEKLLEKYKATAAENQGAVKQLESLRQENSQLVQRMDQVDQTTKTYQAEIAKLQEKLSTMADASPEAKRETQLLEASYQSAISQIKDLESKAQRLTGENQEYLGQIASLKAAQEKAMNTVPADSNQTEWARKNQQLTAAKQNLEQKNQQLSQNFSELDRRYNALSQQQQKLADDNKRLNDQIANLNVIDSDVNTGQISEVAAITAAPTATVIPPSVDLSPYETKISQLTRKNRQLSESNAKFTNENRSLSGQLATLKKRSVRAATSQSSVSSVIAPASLPTNLPAAAAVVSKKEGGWGILAWLIPFLAIGLGVAFFVIIKEELHRPSGGATTRSAQKD